MSPVTAEQLEEWRALADSATSGPWTTERPGRDAATGFVAGVIVAAVARGQGVYANPSGGSYPENDRRFIAAARTAVPALIAEIERLREALRKPAHGDSDAGARLLADFIGVHFDHLLRDFRPDGYRMWSVNGVGARSYNGGREGLREVAAAIARAALPEDPADGE